jgi:hypothetical protein
LLGVLDLAKAQQRAREADQSTDATTGANGQPHEAPSVT